MKTPICDFVNNYIARNAQRFHMPGHKGQNRLGYEKADLTEVDGADSLFSASSIIAESERNAGQLFGAHTFYSTEGASLAIKAMMHLATRHAKANGQTPLVVAGRNAHKAFVSAAALVGFDVEWLFATNGSYLSSVVSAAELEQFLDSLQTKPTAVYLTTPDYLGNMVDLRSIATVCKKRNILLLVDNAHGAYLKFVEPSCHPMDLGADMCCDSAHKTLPCLTGGAYLHIAKSAPSEFCDQAKSALALFGSTSPSYLILQSLDQVNAYLADGYAQKLATYLQKIDIFKQALLCNGWTLCGNEGLKVTLDAKKYGYTGDELAQLLDARGIVCEFHDPDYLVLMLTPDNGDLVPLQEALLSIAQRTQHPATTPAITRPQKAMSIREATLAPCKMVDVSQACGMVLADLSVGCPPAVPILVCGEKIDDQAIQRFRYYGVDKVCVVK